MKEHGGPGTAGQAPSAEAPRGPWWPGAQPATTSTQPGQLWGPTHAPGQRRRVQRPLPSVKGWPPALVRGPLGTLGASWAFKVPQAAHLPPLPSPAQGTPGQAVTHLPGHLDGASPAQGSRLGLNSAISSGLRHICLCPVGFCLRQGFTLCCPRTSCPGSTGWKPHKGSSPNLFFAKTR